MISPEVLQALLSSDSGIRCQAETIFQSLSVPERIQALTNHLLALSCISDKRSEHGALTMLTAVLLRRDILKLTDPSMLDDLVTPLLQCYNASSHFGSSCKLQIGHCLAEVCSSHSIISNGGDAAVPVLSKILLAINLQDDVSLRLLASLADRAPMAFSKVAVPSLSSLVQSTLCNLPSTNIITTVNSVANLTQVVVNGAIATTVSSVALVRVAPNLDELAIEETSVASDLGESCLWKLLGPISSCADETTQIECFQYLSQAAVICPSLLAGKFNVLQAVVQLCLGVAHSSTSSPADKQAPGVALSAMQVMTSLLSVGDFRRRILSPAMAEQIAQQAVSICAQLMAQSLDNDNDSVGEWASEPATLVEGGVEDEDDDALFAESLMESFWQNLATPALTVAIPLVQQLLQASNNWRNVRAGLAILEIGLVAAPISLAPHIPDIVKAATSMAENASNPRVQYQATRLLGALCETHSSVREVYGQVILTQMAAGLGSPVSKVSSMASLGVVAYCRGNTAVIDQDGGELDASQFLVPYLPDLMQALMKPLSINATDTGSVTVRVHAMNAVACLAEASGDAFGPFYLDIMPGLLYSVQLPQPELATAALQSLTIVGQAAGKDLFQGDATKVLSWIIPVLPQASGAVATSFFATEELLTACARIASVMKEDFAPYIEAVLPALYRQAEATVDITVEEGNEAGMQNSDTDEDGTESMTVALPGRGFQRFTINTTAVQEKAGNNRAMFELAKALGATFGLHVQKSLEVFSPLAKFKYSADVRSTAAQTLSALFDDACSYGEQIGDMTIAKHYLPLLADGISEQIVQEDPTDAEALYASADSLSEIFHIVFRYRNKPLVHEVLKGLSMQNIEAIVKRCMQAMSSCLERRANVNRILGGNLSGDDEKEEYSSHLRAEESLLTPLVDSVGYLLKFSKADFVPVFEKHVVPILGQYLISTVDVRASVASMCLFDDCVEYCGSKAATTYSPLLLQGVIAAMQEPSKYDRDLVQASVYGISQMARYSPRTILAPHIQTIVHELLNLSQGSKEEAGDNMYLHEISVSALASLILFGPFADAKFVNRDSVINVFLDNLPLEEDEDEAKICHAGLCTLVENGSINPVTESTRMTQITGAILFAVREGLEVATPDTCERLMKILHEIRQQNPQGMMQAYAGLHGEAQSVLNFAFQEYSYSRSHVITP